MGGRHKPNGFIRGGRNMECGRQYGGQLYQHDGGNDCIVVSWARQLLADQHAAYIAARPTKRHGQDAKLAAFIRSSFHQLRGQQLRGADQRAERSWSVYGDTWQSHRDFNQHVPGFQRQEHILRAGLLLRRAAGLLKAPQGSGPDDSGLDDLGLSFFSS